MHQMTERLSSPWLPRMLFRLTIGLSALLIMLVFLCPWLDNEQTQTRGWRQVIGLFGRDVALRRTTLASAVGLIVTACVFFRQPTMPPRVPPKPRGQAPPSEMAGA
jgi:hypothetical protein